jgi:hypothetical protein
MHSCGDALTSGQVDRVGILEGLELVQVQQDVAWRGVKNRRSSRDHPGQKGVPANYPVERGSYCCGPSSHTPPKWKQPHEPAQKPYAHRKEDPPSFPNVCSSMHPPMNTQRRTSDWPILSLFSGAGGLDLGFERAGFGIELAVDNWEPAVRTYRRNHSHTRVEQLDLGDMPARRLLHLWDSSSGPRLAL